MKCKGEISGSCHSTYPLYRRIQAPAGCGMKEGLRGTHRHLHTARPGTASLFPCRKENPHHPLQHIRGLASTEKHGARKASTQSISAEGGRDAFSL